MIRAEHFDYCGALDGPEANKQHTTDSLISGPDTECSGPYDWHPHLYHGPNTLLLWPKQVHVFEKSVSAA